METSILISIYLIISSIAFVINYRKTESPYYVKKALEDLILCLTPLNFLVVVYFTIEFIVDLIQENIKIPYGKINLFLNRRLK